jgi:hypothetical protein
LDVTPTSAFTADGRLTGMVGVKMGELAIGVPPEWAHDASTGGAATHPKVSHSCEPVGGGCPRIRRLFVEFV